MTKQEKIQKGIDNILHNCYSKDLSACSLHKIFQPVKGRNELLKYLHSQGVGIKGELPSIFDANEDVISALEYKKKLVGFFELLIEEE